MHFIAGSRNISALIIKCSNFRQGCEWTGELRSLEPHLENCEYELVECENKCADLKGETTLVLRKDDLIHLNLECPNRLAACELCSEQGKYFEITGIHKEMCPGVEIQCTNAGCEVTVKRGELSSHRKTCEHELVSCKYADFGCEEKGTRKEVLGHEEDIKLHLDGIVKYVRHLKRDNLLQARAEIQALQAKQTAMAEYMATYFDSLYKVIQQQIGYLPETRYKETGQAHVTFKLPNFLEYKEKKEFYSPPFYSSPGGYKMCVRLSFNNTTRYIVAYIYLMRGENDDNLQWPFRSAEIGIELLNQLKDTDHISKSIVYRADRDSKSNRRVTDGERAGSGYGKAMLLKIDDEDQSEPYLVDDTLYFRVTVLRAPSPCKPWLVCNV